MPKTPKPAVKNQPTLYQFKITLLDSSPPIWRRIVVPDGALDELHEHIQSAMGWTNSHLHQFEIRGRRYGDPELLDDGWGEADFIDSLATTLGDLFGGKRPPRRFLYEYDFGDGWGHQIDFEGPVAPEPRLKYPRCVDGARACPPEDVGGVWGYANFLEIIRDPKHEEYEFYSEWIGDKFDPEKFSPVAATRTMRQGLPNWRDDG